MDEASVHTSPNRLFKSPENTTTLWSTPNGLHDDYKPGSDILALLEGLNEMPEWLCTPLRRLSTPEATQLAYEDRPTLDPTAFQPFEPYDNLFHPAL